MTLYDHIQELRTELRSCSMTHAERVRAEAALRAAIAAQAEIDRAFDSALEVLTELGQG